MTKKKHNMHHGYRSYRNPFGSTTEKLVKDGGWAIVGGVATRAVPENFLSKYNSGIVGYFMNLVVAFGGAAGLEKVVKESGFGFALGGIVMTAGRIISDFFGKTVVQFTYPLGAQSGTQPSASAAAVPAGASGLGNFGDPSFNLGMIVKQYNYPIPWKPEAAIAAAALPAAPMTERKMETPRRRFPLSRRHEAVM